MIKSNHKKMCFPCVISFCKIGNADNENQRCITGKKITWPGNRRMKRQLHSARWTMIYATGKLMTI